MISDIMGIVIVMYSIALSPSHLIDKHCIKEPESDVSGHIKLNISYTIDGSEEEIMTTLHDVYTKLHEVSKHAICAHSHNLHLTLFLCFLYYSANFHSLSCSSADEISTNSIKDDPLRKVSEVWRMYNHAITIL